MKTHIQCPKTEDRQCSMVFSPETHEYDNLHVARVKEHDQIRLRKLHQFLYDEMTERDKKTRNDRSIQIFKERKKQAVFLNYDLRFVSQSQSKSVLFC